MAVRFQGKVMEGKEIAPGIYVIEDVKGKVDRNRKPSTDVITDSILVHAPSDAVRKRLRKLLRTKQA